MILAPLQKLPKNVGDLGKFIVAKGFKKLPKVQKIAKSGNTAGDRTRHSSDDVTEEVHHSDPSAMGVTGLPDNLPIQQKDRLFLSGNLFNFILKNTQLTVQWGSYQASQ